MTRTVTITGSSGFVGQLLCRGLAAEGWSVEPFDRFRGTLVDLTRRRHLTNATSLPGRSVAKALRGTQANTERVLHRVHAIRPRADDITGPREQLAERFKGSSAVIHLAGWPHPDWPGATQEDWIDLNYEGSVNVFEAARDAGVETFVFASSAQVYRINDPVRIEQLPILESNHLPLPQEGQSTYGFLKVAVERYLAGACMTGKTQAISLRLEFPGMRSSSPSNLYISTSLENLISGFSCALRPPAGLGFEAFNLADGEIQPRHSRYPGICA